MVVTDGAIYATQRAPLQAQITNLLKNAPAHAVEGEILAVVVPDTNLLESGGVAAEVFKCLSGRQYQTVILVTPTHTRRFRRMTICRLDQYQTPLGELTVNDRLRNELCDEDDDIFLDDEGHFHTEGVDVALPFLQNVLPDFDIVPIVMGEETPEFCRELGNAIGEITYNRRALIVATVDVLEGTEEALERFRQLFEERDVSRLMSFLNSETLHVEGKGALLVALIAAMLRRGTHAQVLRTVPSESHRPGAIGAIITAE